MLHISIHQEPSFTLCEKCFKGGNYEDKLADDFKFIENINQATAWTEAETLLLLDAVLKHGDDWELVARTVQTKSKLECISRLIQLPFGDLMLGAGNGKSTYLDVIGDISNSKQMEVASNETQESTKAEDQMPEPVDKEKSPELKDEDQQNGDAENEGPPRKRVCSEPTSDSGNSLMKQVPLLISLCLIIICLVCLLKYLLYVFVIFLQLCLLVKPKCKF